MTKAVVVLTGKSVDTILEEGGSSAWRLDRNNARQCSYAICTRNAHADWTEGSEPHHAGFLIGRISDVVDAPNHVGRFLIQFSEYALINVPNVWKRDRNPVKYEELEAVGIDPDKLDWKPMPTAKQVPSSTPKSPPLQSGSSVGALTMDQAKRGLALTFGVKPEAIEIVIRG